MRTLIVQAKTPEEFTQLDDAARKNHNVKFAQYSTPVLNFGSYSQIVYVGFLMYEERTGGAQ